MAEEYEDMQAIMSKEQLSPLITDIMKLIGGRTKGPGEAALVLSACLAFLKDSYGIEVTEFTTIKEAIGNA